MYIEILCPAPATAVPAVACPENFIVQLAVTHAQPRLEGIRLRVRRVKDFLRVEDERECVGGVYLYV